MICADDVLHETSELRWKIREDTRRSRFCTCSWESDRGDSMSYLYLWLLYCCFRHCCHCFAASHHLPPTRQPSPLIVLLLSYYCPIITYTNVLVTHWSEKRHGHMCNQSSHGHVVFWYVFNYTYDTFYTCFTH